MCEFTVSCFEKKQKNNVKRQAIILRKQLRCISLIKIVLNKLAQNMKSQDYL